jgi:hypothetical protein
MYRNGIKGRSLENVIASHHHNLSRNRDLKLVSLIYELYEHTIETCLP